MSFNPLKGLSLAVLFLLFHAPNTLATTDIEPSNLDDDLKLSAPTDSELSVDQCFDFFVRPITSRLLCKLYTQTATKGVTGMDRKLTVRFNQLAFSDLRETEAFQWQADTFDQCMKVLNIFDRDSFYKSIAARLFQRVIAVRDSFMSRSGVYYGIYPLKEKTCGTFEPDEFRYFEINLEKMTFRGDRKNFELKLFPEFDIILDEK